MLENRRNSDPALLSRGVRFREILATDRDFFNYDTQMIIETYLRSVQGRWSVIDLNAYSPTAENKWERIDKFVSEGKY